MPDALILVGRLRNDDRPGHDVVPLAARPGFAPLLALIILGLSVLDAAATLSLLAAGGEEANPAMRLLLAHGTEAFLAGKIALTAAGLAVLLALRGHRLFGSRIRITHILQGLAAAYATVLVYELALMATTAI